MRRLYSGLPREVAVLTAVAFAVAVGFGVVAPAIPVFAREFGVSITAASGVISAFAFARFAFGLAGGRLVDAFGERLVLASGIGIVAVSSVLAGLAQTYTQLILLRGVGGVGSAMFTVASASLLLRVVESDQRGRANSLFHAGFLIGAIAGPALGGVVTSYSVRAPFFLYAGTLAVAGAIGMVFLAHARLHEKVDAAGTPQRTRLVDALRSQAYRTSLVTSFGAGWAQYGVRSSLLPLFVVEAMRRDAKWTGIGLVVAAAAQGLMLLPAGRLVDQAGRRPVLIAGGVIGTAGTAILALSTAVVPYVVAMVLVGAATALAAPASAAVVGDVVEGRGGTVVAAFQMAGDLGTVVGPLVAGWLADNVSYGAAWGVSAAVLLLSPLMALAMAETRTAAGPPAPRPTPPAAPASDVR